MEIVLLITCFVVGLLWAAYSETKRCPHCGKKGETRLLFNACPRCGRNRNRPEGLI